LHRRIGRIQRTKGGEALAERETALVNLAALAAIGEKRAPALFDRFRARWLRTFATLGILLVGALGGHDEDAGFLPVLRRGHDFALLPEARVRDEQELAQLLPPAGLAAGGMTDQPTVRIGRQGMRRVALDHEQEGFAGEQP